MTRWLYRVLLGAEPHAELSAREAGAVLWRVGWALLRGLRWRPFLRRAEGALLVGARVRILDAHRLEVGRRVKIEDLAEIQCRSRRGVRFASGVTIGRGVSIRPSSYYGGEPGEGLEVGEGSAIGAGSWIGASGFVSIGRDVLLGPHVLILPENHAFEDGATTIKSQGVRRASVVIEDDCWIGARAVLLAGVRIGRGAVVAAGAVVTHDVPSQAIVAGVPARVVRARGETRLGAA